MELNNKQKEAVSATEGPCLILAGAGSGKTRVIVERVKYLIENMNVHPNKILSITFTNKAAKEMKDRISESLNREGSSDMSVSTYHSFALSILKKRAKYIEGHSSGFKVYIPNDVISLIKNVIVDCGFQHTKSNQDDFVPFRKTLGKISDYKNLLVRPQDLEIMDSDYGFHNWEKINKVSESMNEVEFDKFIEIYKEYDKRMKMHNALDFDDLIMKLVFMFEDNPDVLKIYQQYYQYINIDEFQDTNLAQYVLAKQLSYLHKNITVVGDDYQSIYKFRGSEIDIILNFKDDFENVKEIKLEQNYRSKSHIVEAADALIKNNEVQLHKHLFTDNDKGSRVRVQRVNTIYDEADFVLSKINEYIRSGYNESDIAILYRSASKTYAFESKLVEAGYSYQMSGSRSFFQRKEIQDVIYYLRYLLDTNDGIFFERISNVPKRGVSTVTVNKIVEYARENNQTIEEVLKDPSGLKRVNKNAKEGIAQLHSMIEEYKEKLLNQSVSEVVVDLINDLDLINTVYHNEDDDQKRRRKESLEQLMVITASEENKTKTLTEFVDDLVLDPIDEKQENKIQMMTIHASKGLEFPIVFVINMNEGYFPGYFVDKNDLEEMEEERRVAYVALTRAKEILNVVYSKYDLVRKGRFFDKEYMKPSLFVEELPKRNIVRAN